MSARPRSATGWPIRVSNTPFDVYVFDFDGTLVDSAPLKREAFFRLLPDDCRQIVARVLDADPDGSRHVVIPRMLSMAHGAGLAQEITHADALVREYGRLVEEGVSQAAPMARADELVAKAAAHASYVASMTPQDQLERFVAARGWRGSFIQLFGFPLAKADVVSGLLRHHAIPAARLLVVGDGESDRQAASVNGAGFHHVTGPQSLAHIPGLEL